MANSEFTAIACGDDYTTAATIRDVYGSGGGVFEIQDQAVTYKLQYGGLGEDFWTPDATIGTGGGPIPEGVTGVAFKNAAAGQVATVSALIRPKTQPHLSLQFAAPVTATSVGADGWSAAGGNFGFSSADGPTFVMLTSQDLTSVVGVGDRIKLTQGVTTLFFIVTAINAVSVTLYGGTSNVLANAAITGVSYSHSKTPLGFNASPALWTQQLLDNNLQQQIGPVNNTWYNLGGLSLSVPIGVWELSYNVVANTYFAGAFELPLDVTLSTANNTESDTEFTTGGNALQNGASNGLMVPCAKSKTITRASKVTYFLNMRQNTGVTQINFVPSTIMGGGVTRIRAVCALL